MQGFESDFCKSANVVCEDWDKYSQVTVYFWCVVHLCMFAYTCMHAYLYVTVHVYFFKYTWSSYNKMLVFRVTVCQQDNEIGKVNDFFFFYLIKPKKNVQKSYKMVTILCRYQKEKNILCTPTFYVAKMNLTGQW